MDVKHPTFDKDGYPSDETLELIKKWPFETIKEVIPFIAEAWHYPDMAKEVRPGLWTFATGGWSGNECLFDSLTQNYIGSGRLHWNSLYLPGGLHVIALTEEAEKEMDKLFEYITKWAWKNA